MNDMDLSREFKKKAAVKIAIITLLLLFNINMIIDAAVSFNEEITWNSDSRRISQYDRYLNEGDYNGLRTTMLLNDSFDKPFDSYWEIADAYELLSEYKVLYRASQNPELQAEAYVDGMKEKKDQLLKLCASSVFDKNKRILDSFAAEIE